MLLGTCSSRCGKKIDMRWTLPIIAKDDECNIKTGCQPGCEKHLGQKSMWTFCGEPCWKAFRKMIYGPEDEAIKGGTDRIQICSGCQKQHINKPKLKRCKRCMLAIYCNETCQKNHWNKEHKKQCD